MVAHLLPVEKGPVDDALVGLPEDGVEGLVAADVAARTGERKFYDLLEPLQRRELTSAGQKEGGEAEGPQKKGQV